MSRIQEIQATKDGAATLGNPSNCPNLLPKESFQTVGLGGGTQGEISGFPALKT